MSEQLLVHDQQEGGAVDPNHCPPTLEAICSAASVLRDQNPDETATDTNGEIHKVIRLTVDMSVVALEGLAARARQMFRGEVTFEPPYGAMLGSSLDVGFRKEAHTLVA